jgi:hypothetical protein
MIRTYTFTIASQEWGFYFFIIIRENKDPKKAKAVPLHATEVLKGRGGIALRHS